MFKFLIKNIHHIKLHPPTHVTIHSSFTANDAHGQPYIETGTQPQELVVAGVGARGELGRGIVPNHRKITTHQTQPIRYHPAGAPPQLWNIAHAGRTWQSQNVSGRASVRCAGACDPTQRLVSKRAVPARSPAIQ